MFGNLHPLETAHWDLGQTAMVQGVARLSAVHGPNQASLTQLKPGCGILEGPTCCYLSIVSRRSAHGLLGLNLRWASVVTVFPFLLRCEDRTGTA